MSRRKEEPFATGSSWMLVGFAINTITGMIFFIATPAQYMQNVAFHYKMIFMV